MLLINLVHPIRYVLAKCISSTCTYAIITKQIMCKFGWAGRQLFQLSIIKFSGLCKRISPASPRTLRLAGSKPNQAGSPGNTIFFCFLLQICGVITHYLASQETTKPSKIWPSYVLQSLLLCKSVSKFLCTWRSSLAPEKFAYLPQVHMLTVVYEYVRME